VRPECRIHRSQCCERCGREGVGTGRRHVRDVPPRHRVEPGQRAVAAVARRFQNLRCNNAGFNREAIEVWERTQRLNPFLPGVWFGLRAAPHIMLREFEPALRLARLCTERTPSYYSCFVYLAIAARELGTYSA
jgi:hypothetical protein